MLEILLNVLQTVCKKHLWCVFASIRICNLSTRIPFDIWNLELINTRGLPLWIKTGLQLRRFRREENQQKFIHLPCPDCGNAIIKTSKWPHKFQKAFLAGHQLSSKCCACGCGQNWLVWSQADSKAGWGKPRKGQPDYSISFVFIFCIFKL